jgi:hypothetical protein
VHGSGLWVMRVLFSARFRFVVACRVNFLVS